MKKASIFLIFLILSACHYRGVEQTTPTQFIRPDLIDQENHVACYYLNNGSSGTAMSCVRLK